MTKIITKPEVCPAVKRECFYCEQDKDGLICSYVMGCVFKDESGIAFDIATGFDEDVLREVHMNVNHVRIDPDYCLAAIETLLDCCDFKPNLVICGRCGTVWKAAQYGTSPGALCNDCLNHEHIVRKGRTIKEALAKCRGNQN